MKKVFIFVLALMLAFTASAEILFDENACSYAMDFYEIPELSIQMCVPYTFEQSEVSQEMYDTMGVVALFYGFGDNVVTVSKIDDIGSYFNQDEIEGYDIINGIDTIWYFNPEYGERYIAFPLTDGAWGVIAYYSMYDAEMDDMTREMITGIMPLYY